MRSKTLMVGVGVVLSLLFSVAGIVFAGSLDPTTGPGDPASQMYTLEQIYNRLLGSGNATKMTAFTEPSDWPMVGTMHTLDDIYALAWPARVPKTGQTASYAAGDDGDLEKGVAWPSPRFTDNGNGTVTDSLTGLTWLKNAYCASATRNWATALTDVASLNSAGTMNSNNCGDTSNSGSHQTDWRLPNVRELLSLIDYGRAGPALPGGHPFTNVQLGWYWTSTTIPSDSTLTWVVHMSGGKVDYGLKTSSQYVWPVRGGP